jgi:hypothetical protein
MRMAERASIGNGQGRLYPYLLMLKPDPSGEWPNHSNNPRMGCQLLPFGKFQNTLASFHVHLLVRNMMHGIICSMPDPRERGWKSAHCK